MKLPSIADTQRPSLNPQMGVASYQPENAGAAMAPGAALSDLGHQITAMADEQMKRIDTLRAEDATNQLLQKKQDLTLGEDGFLKKKGADAVTKPILPDYVKRYDDSASQIAEGLGNNRQRELFQQRANAFKLQYQDDLLRHIVQQGDVYQNQTDQAGFKLSASSAATDWDKPDSVGVSVARINGLIDAHTDWSPEYKEAMRQQKLGDLHEGVISQALANKNYVYAEDWFKSHQDQMDEQTKKTLGARVEDGLQRQLTNNYQTEYLALQDNAKGLNVLEKKVQGDDKLDDERKNILVSRIQARHEMLANQAERAYQHQMTQAAATYQTVQTMVDKGGFVDPTYAAQVLDQTKGTPYQAALKTIMEQAKTTGGIAQQPVSKQQDMLTAVDAEIAQKGRTPELDKRRDQIAKIVTASQADLAKDPMHAGLERGVISTFGQIDVSSPDAIAKTLPQRLPQAGIVSQWAGKPVSPFTGAEADSIQQMLSAMPPKQRAAAVATIASAAGPGAGNAIASQLAEKDKPLALAFGFAGDRTTSGRPTSELVLNGQQALKDNVVMKDPDKITGTRSSIAEKVNGAFPNQNLSEATKEAAYLIAAGLAAEQGYRGNIPNNLLQQAVDLAAGGPVIDRTAGDTKYRLVLPAGMDESAFDARLSAIQPKDLKSQAKDETVIAGGVKMPVEQLIKSLPGQQLMYLEPGKYAVLVKNRPVRTTDNKPLILGVH